jgi:hypothetical protein
MLALHLPPPFTEASPSVTAASPAATAALSPLAQPLASISGAGVTPGTSPFPTPSLLCGLPRTATLGNPLNPAASPACVTAPAPGESASAAIPRLIAEAVDLLELPGDAISHILAFLQPDEENSAPQQQLLVNSAFAPAVHSTPRLIPRHHWQPSQTNSETAEPATASAVTTPQIDARAEPDDPSQSSASPVGAALLQRKRVHQALASVDKALGQVSQTPPPSPQALIH